MALLDWVWVRAEGVNLFPKYGAVSVVYTRNVSF